MVFKFVYLVDLTKGYQSEMFYCCKLSGSSFIEELQKYNEDVIMRSLHILGFEIFIFFESTYKLSVCQVSSSLVISESNFTEVSIRHPKTPL